MSYNYPLSLQDRKTILDELIAQKVQEGYVLNSRDDTTANLTKPKKFHILIALLAFCLFGFGLILYLLYFFLQKEEVITLDVNEYYGQKESAANS